MSTLKLAIAVMAVAALAARPLEAQFGSAYVSASQLYQQGTVFTAHSDWGPQCIWHGREPDGAIVYAWGEQRECVGNAVAWSYDLDGDGKVELNAWPQRLPYCGVQIRAWQWVVNGTISEYVRGECIYDATVGQYVYKYNYYSDRAGNQCAQIVTGLHSRRGAAYEALRLALINSPNDRLLLKRLWHNYNQAHLTLLACGGR